jgi:5-methylcytosine-specific restriction endonuclease McrA
MRLRKERKRERQKQYYQENRERIRARQKEWDKKNREKRRGQRREYQHKYFQDNKKRIAARREAFKMAHPDKVSEAQSRYTKKWRDANQAKVRAQEKVRRARLLGASGSMPDNAWEILLDTYGPSCMNPNCSGKSLELTHDHVVPLSKGGEHSLANSQILCRSCNASKGAKTIDYRS